MRKLPADQLGSMLESYRPWCRIYLRQALQGSIGRRVDESDIIQATWMDVLRKIDQFQGGTEAEFFAWLRTSLTNNLKNTLRDHQAAKRDIRREFELNRGMDTATLYWVEPTANNDSPSDHAIKGENALALASALEKLPPNQRLAIELRHLQGLKLQVVCDVMEKTPDAVVALIRRGMQTLTSTLPPTTFSVK